MKVTFEVTSGESSVGGSLSKMSGPVGFCPDLQRKASYNLSNIFSLVSVEVENDWVILGGMHYGTEFYNSLHCS